MKSIEKLPYLLSMDFNAWIVTTRENPNHVEVIVEPDYHWPRALKFLREEYGAMNKPGSSWIYLTDGSTNLHVGPLRLDDFVMRAQHKFTYRHVGRAVTLQEI